MMLILYGNYYYITFAFAEYIYFFTFNIFCLWFCFTSTKSITVFMCPYMNGTIKTLNPIYFLFCLVYLTICLMFFPPQEFPIKASYFITNTCWVTAQPCLIFPHRHADTSCQSHCRGTISLLSLPPTRIDAQNKGNSFSFCCGKLYFPGNTSIFYICFLDQWFIIIFTHIESSGKFLQKGNVWATPNLTPLPNQDSDLIPLGWALKMSTLIKMSSSDLIVARISIIYYSPAFPFCPCSSHFVLPTHSELWNRFLLML